MLKSKRLSVLPGFTDSECLEYKTIGFLTTIVYESGYSDELNTSDAEFKIARFYVLLADKNEVIFVPAVIPQ